MDCFDIYVHELLMNSPRNGKIRINEKRFDILDKIFDILRKIRNKIYWFQDFKYSIIEYAYGSINGDFYTIDLDNIKDKVKIYIEKVFKTELGGSRKIRVFSIF